MNSNYEDAVTKPTSKDLAEAEPVKTAVEHALEVEVRKKKNLGILEALRGEIHRVRSKNHGRKVVLFLSYDFHKEIFYGRNPAVSGIIQELDDNATLFGYEVRVFVVPHNRSRKRDERDFYVFPV